MADSEVHVRYKTKCDLSDFFREWETDRLEKKKHHDIAQQLTEMLEKGLFRCSPEMVFKVIVSLRVPQLLRGADRNEIAKRFEDCDPEEEKKIYEELPAILRPMTSNLITIWNTQISP